jgi:hypothetical protein
MLSRNDNGIIKAALRLVYTHVHTGEIPNDLAIPITQRDLIDLSLMFVNLNDVVLSTRMFALIGAQQVPTYFDLRMVLLSVFQNQ